MIANHSGQIDDRDQNKLVLSDISNNAFYDGTEVKVSPAENGQISYQIPYRLAVTLPGIFEDIDRDPKVYGIAEYIVRVSTLEEVFIEIGRKENAIQDEEFKK